MNAMRQNPVSPINQAFQSISRDATTRLRKLSDACAVLRPEDISDVRKDIEQIVAEVYFGTNKHLKKLES